MSRLAFSDMLIKVRNLSKVSTLNGLWTSGLRVSKSFANRLAVLRLGIFDSWRAALAALSLKIETFAGSSLPWRRDVKIESFGETGSQCIV